jgi:hypothetical protein
MWSQHIRLAIVRLLNTICERVDDIAYRPAFVKVTQRLPWFWCCQLAHFSMKLDDRWGTGFWKGTKAPPAPDGPCDACGRRAGWLEIGGYYEGLEDYDPGDDEYLAAHPVTLCGWCHLDIDSAGPPRNDAELQRLLADARSRSVEWRWRWHTG